MKLNKIDEGQNSVNSPFEWIFGLLSSKNLATMAIWHNDFSSLLADADAFSNSHIRGNAVM